MLENIKNYIYNVGLSGGYSDYDEKVEGIALDILNGYNGSFHDADGNVHTYSHVRYELNI
jgi:hypothetical protein